VVQRSSLKGGSDLAAAVNRLIEALDDYNDVKEVYSNAEFSK
jgi:transcriptional/translational regulatory protein YebC/TACO1